MLPDELVAAPDIESALVQHLGGALSVHVGTLIPSESHTTFIRVQRQGGQRQNPGLTDARVTVECWDPSDYKAFQLAQRAEALVFQCSGTFVHGVWLSDITETGGIVNRWDVDRTNLPRYQFTVTITMATEVLS